MGHRKRRWLIAIPLLAVAQSTGPQEMRLSAVPYFPKPATTIRTETNLVDIAAVVRDSRGNPVGGLTKSDFEVRDEGKRRDIAALYVAGIEGVLEPALQDATYQHVLKAGFNADLRMDVPTGSYRLRTVVVEGDDNGRYSTATQTVEFR